MTYEMNRPRYPGTPRYAQTIVGYNAQSPCPTVGGRDTAATVWRKQMGQINPTVAECVAQGLCLNLATGACEPCILPGGGGQPPPGIPPGLPAVVPETECQKRAAAAFERGKREESGKVWKTAAISAAVSVVVGAAVGWGLKKASR